MAIIVAHPGTQHSAHAARGLKRAGLLECLYTSFSLQRPDWLGRIIKTVAPSAYVRFAQHRSHAGLSPDELRVFLPALVASRMGTRWVRAASRSFSRSAGRLAVRRGAGVMAFDTNATETFRLLEGRGLARILDQSIAHWRWLERVVDEERDRFQDWQRPTDEWRATPSELEEEEEGLARADLILCGSEFCASTMVAEGVKREKVAVVEYGADTNRFFPGAVAERKTNVRLLFVGSIGLRKGLPYLLEAVKRVQGLGVELTLAGGVRLRQDALLPYSSFARVRGTLLHAEMPSLYRSHDIYVFPSLVEGSSLSIYEALASGLPVITTPSSGSIVHDGIEGIIVRERDVDGLAAAIEKLVRDPELRVEMAMRARRRATEFGDWTHYGERLANTIRSKCSAGSRTPDADGRTGGPEQLGRTV